MSMISSLLSGGINPAIQAAENRTLGLGSTPAPGVAPAGQPGPAGEAAVASDGSTQATMGAAAVQPTPPQPMKIILSSVGRGAVSGAAMMFGLNNFGHKLPFVGPTLVKVMGKTLSMVPFLKLTFPFSSTLVALGAGAVVGGIFGLISGLAKSRKAAAEYAKAEAAAAAAQAPAVGDPTAAPGAPGLPGLDPAAPPAPPAVPDAGKAKKNPVMDSGYKAKAKRTSKGKRVAGAADGPGRKHHIKRGDTLWALSRRYGVSIDAIVKANAKIKDPDLIYAGDTIVIPRAA